MVVPEARRTTQLPRRCRSFFDAEKCSTSFTWRSPTTMSARPSRIGPTSRGMSPAWYWWSASVLTMTSAPSFREASMPAWNAAARPLLLVSRTMWSTPFARATSTVRSVEPSSITSHSTSSKPVSRRGSSRRTWGRVSSSSRHGIWITSFMPRGHGTAHGTNCGNVAHPQLVWARTCRRRAGAGRGGEWRDRRLVPPQLEARLGPHEHARLHPHPHAGAHEATRARPRRVLAVAVGDGHSAVGAAQVAHDSPPSSARICRIRR